MPVDTYTQAKLFTRIMMDPDHTFREALTTDPSIVGDNNMLEVRDAYNHIQRVANGTYEEFRDLCVLLKDDLRRVEEEMAAGADIDLTEFRYAAREAARLAELYATADGTHFYLAEPDAARLAARVAELYATADGTHFNLAEPGDNDATGDNDENAPPADE